MVRKPMLTEFLMRQDEALVPRQELHDIDDYRRDVLPSKGPSAKLWNSGANGAQAAQVVRLSLMAAEQNSFFPVMGSG